MNLPPRLPLRPLRDTYQVSEDGEAKPQASQGTQTTPVTTSQSSGLRRSGDPQCLGHVYLTVGPGAPGPMCGQPPFQNAVIGVGTHSSWQNPCWFPVPQREGYYVGKAEGKPPGPPGPRKIVKQSSEASPTGVQRSVPRQGPRAQEGDSQHSPLLLGLCSRRQIMTAKLVRWQLQPQPLFLTCFRC